MRTNYRTVIDGSLVVGTLLTLEEAQADPEGRAIFEMFMAHPDLLIIKDAKVFVGPAMAEADFYIKINRKPGVLMGKCTISPFTSAS